MKKTSILCFILCIMLVVSSLSFGFSAKEAEIAQTGNNVYYIETYEQLKNLACTAQRDCRYILNDNIYQDDNKNDIEIVIPAGAYFNLDLNGYTIQRSTMGNDCALFRIKSDATMIINDTSASQTGSCVFSEGYSSYYKAVFYNDGGELEINGGYYEILSPYEQGDCSVVRATSGYTYIHDGTFDSSSSWGGDTISVGHNAYMYEVPRVVIFGGEFYGKYQSIDVTPFSNYLDYGCLFPSVYVLGGNFYITNGGKNGEDASFAYCNNGWGRVIVAEGTVLFKCLNSRDQMFLDGVSKKLFTQTIDDYEEGYYKVTAPPMIMSENLDYYYRLINLCKKEEVRSYERYSVVQEYHSEEFDYILNSFDTINVTAEEETSPTIELVNRSTDHKYIRWYMCDESSYNGADTQWTYLGDFDDVSNWQLDERPEEGGNYLIRCVVTNSDLTTYEDVVRITYAPLKSTETIQVAKVTGVTPPVAGEKPSLNALAETTGLEITDVSWYDDTDAHSTELSADSTFMEGYTYRVVVSLKTLEGYKFLYSDGYNEAEGLINGEKAIAYGSHDDNMLDIGLTFEPCKAKPTEPENPTEPEKPTDSEPTSSPDATEKPTEDEKPTSPDVTENPTEPEKPTDPDATEKPTEPEVIGILGDADCNGKVNVKDATAIQKHVASLISLSETGVILADVDANAIVNIKDATAIQKYVADMNTGLPIGQPVKR